MAKDVKHPKTLRLTAVRKNNSKDKGHDPDIIGGKHRVTDSKTNHNAASPPAHIFASGGLAC